ncbi:MAG: type II secretion system F family protein [Planctomycetaceae bacterium]|nr:type II secretion system F family protein [Planctomycetaceae bacterium]
MEPTQKMILITGVALAVTVYLIYKFYRWRRHNSQPVGRPMAKKRPKGVSSQPVVESEFGQPTARKTLPTGESVEVRQAPPLPASASIHSEEEVRPIPAKTASATRSATPGVNWTPEPVQENRQGHFFDDVEEDYPYARTDDYNFGPVTSSLAALLPTTDERRRKETRLLRNAGYYEPHAWHNYAALRYLGIMIPLVFFGILLVIAPPEMENLLLAGLIVGPIIGWSLPGLLIQGRSEERLREIENGMPDMLDLLNMCVSQGMTVPRALGRVGKELEEVYPALSKELKIVTDQAHVGNLSQALTNFSARVDVPEVHSFTSLLIQTEQMGTSVSHALADYSDGMRESIRQRADQKANAATFKLLFPTVLCLMPAVYLFLLGPAIIELNDFFASGGTDALGGNIPAEIRTE